MNVLIQHTSIYVIAVFVLMSTHFSESVFVKPSLANNVAAFAHISVSPKCTSDHDGRSCNDTCPSRTNLSPPDYKPLLAKESSCTNASNLPSNAYGINGNIHFKNGSNCNSVNTTVATSVSGSFTFSTWIKISGLDQSMLFSIGDQLTVTGNSSALLIATTYIGKLKSLTWIHLALRYNGDLDVFIDGARFSNYTRPMKSGQYHLVIGPNKDLSANEVLDMADARWYKDVLTDREIDYLKTGKLLKLSVDSDCRCPDTHPILHKTSGNGLQRFLFCENRHGSIGKRLNADAHPTVYIVDDDNNTYWDSGIVRDAKITITIGKILQLKGVVLYGLQSSRSMPVIFMNGKTFTAKQNGSTATVDFEEQLSYAENRTAYERLLTDKMEISFSASTDVFFTLSEIEMQARCPCYGNDGSCTLNRSSLDYSCKCSSSSNTNDTSCQTCRDTFYREAEDTDCQYQCKCHPDGSTINVCEKVGGQCICKSNIDNSTRACNRCKFNTVNIASDASKGCTACSCNPVGIKSCMNDLTCACKENVETASGKCQQCLSHHFGIENDSGCSPCECDEVGTKEGDIFACDMTSGQCPCKREVTGRRCNICKDGNYNLNIKNTFGCEACECNFVGRTNETCDNQTGQCPCRQAVSGNRICKPAHISLEPAYGPVAGGTRITVSGELLGDGSIDVRLTLGDKKLDVEKNDTMIIARTKRSDSVREAPLTIVWSKHNETYEDKTFDMKFSFKKDPKVTIPKEVIKTFASGGCSVDIYGDNLDNVPEPEMFIYTTSWNFTTSCVHAGSSQVTCKTPNLTEALTDEEVTYGIGLDNIHDYHSFPRSQTSIRIEPDPEVSIDEMIEYRNSFDDKIVIKGTGLSKACKDSDVRILLDTVECTILSRTDSEITCDPEEDFPGTSREATIMLNIGDLEIVVGKVNFISFWNTMEFYIIIGCVCGVILVILVIVIAICICRRRRQKSDDRFSATELTTVSSRTANNYVQMDTTTTSSNPEAKDAPLQETTGQVDPAKAFLKRLPTNVAKTIKTSIIEKGQIEPGRQCTKKGGLIRIINGQFGTTSSSPFAGTNLTIKTLIDPYDAKGPVPSWLTDGLVECTRLQDCYNTNVLPMLGISFDDKHLYILYPEMANRSLKDYLKSSSRNITQAKRLDICKQVAEGMNFLDAEHIVHKDLATRNCWVESNEMVKIGDASFSWDLYPDEYLLQNDRYQPVRWMAPESLRQPGFYNSKTDMWSFGVFMWEVFTNAHLPYHDIEDDTQIKNYVCEAGYRLGKPHDCSDIIYKIIEICHGLDSKLRPNFFIILNHLTDIIAGGNPTISYVNQQNFTEDEVDYMNFGQMMGHR